MKKYVCICNKSYSHSQNLSRHKTVCPVVNNQQSMLQQPMLQQPMLQQPMLQQPMLQQPMYLQPPVYQQQPMYIQPMYLPPPLYQQPMYQPSMPEQTSFCLSDYLHSLIPISIEFIKCKYTPDITDFNNVLTHGIKDGIYKNIMTHLKTFNKEQMPFVVTNCQTARFRMMVYINSTWVMHEKYEAIELLNKFADYFILKLFKHMRVFYAHYKEANTPFANESTDYFTKLNLYSLIANSDKHLKSISMELKDYFLIEKNVEL
jgi:hypothetical protein